MKNTRTPPILPPDGYSAYQNYAKANEQTVHAQCWAHARRYFEAALEYEPVGSATALDYIGAFYTQEKIIRDRQLATVEELAYRKKNTQPMVEAFLTGYGSSASARIYYPKINSPRR